MKETQTHPKFKIPFFSGAFGSSIYLSGSLTPLRVKIPFLVAYSFARLYWFGHKFSMLCFWLSLSLEKLSKNGLAVSEKRITANCIVLAMFKKKEEREIFAKCLLRTASAAMFWQRNLKLGKWVALVTGMCFFISMKNYLNLAKL